MPPIKSNVFYQLLQEFASKAPPQPTSPNVQIQKVAAPTDPVTLRDSVQATAGATRPFCFAVAQFAASEMGT